jgi:hypothetical protein
MHGSLIGPSRRPGEEPLTPCATPPDRTHGLQANGMTPLSHPEC